MQISEDKNKDLDDVHLDNLPQKAKKQVFDTRLDVRRSDVDNRATNRTGAVKCKVGVVEFVENSHVLLDCDRAFVDKICSCAVQNFAGKERNYINYARYKDFKNL